MSWPARLASVVAFAALGWAACGGNVSEVPGATCTDVCGGGLTCVGKCMGGPPGTICSCGACVSDADCGPGEKCDESMGFCYSNTKNCMFDTECGCCETCVRTCASAGGTGGG